MIRRSIAGLSVVILALSVGAGPAEAQWWKGWLDRLSGPGEFQGQGVFVEFLCYGVPLFKSSTSGQASSLQIQGAESNAVGHQLRLDIDCSRADRTRWRSTIGVEVAWYTADDNPLTYSGDPPRALREVELRTLMAMVDFVPHRAFEFGAGFGVAWFDGELFGTTSKPMLQPVRVTFKPLALFGTRPALGILQLRAHGTMFPGGFDAADFGAVPGSWRVGTEFLPGFQLVLDFGELLSR